MATKVILNADLYDNVLTEKLGDYVAKPRTCAFLIHLTVGGESSPDEV